MSGYDIADGINFAPNDAPDAPRTTVEPERAALSIRRSIASVETSLTEFEKISAGLAALRTDHPIDLVFEVSTTKGMAEAIAHRAAWRDPRITVEKFRKAAKAPVLTLAKDIDNRAAWLTEQLLLGETPVHEQIKAEEARKAQEKADRDAAEFGRVLKIQESIAEFGMQAMAHHLPSVAIAARLYELRTMELDKAAYQEMMPQAEAARNAAVAKLEVALKAKQWDEALEADRMTAETKRKAEQAAADAERLRVAEANRVEAQRLAGIAAQQEAQAQALAEQHAAQLQQIADGMAALAKAQKEADDRKAAEARAAQDAQATAAKLDAARVAALIPAEPVAALAAQVPAEPVAVAPLPVTAPSLPTVRLKDFAKMLGFALPGAFIVDVLGINPEVIGASALWTDSQAQNIFGGLIEHVSAVMIAHSKQTDTTK